MQLQTPGALSTIFFLLLVVAVVAATLVGAWHSTSESSDKKRRLLFLGICWAAWLGASSVVVHSGFLAQQPMPRLILFFALLNITAVVVSFSAVGGWFTTLPLSVLVGFQSFRFPLELILHDWATAGFIPVAMSWSGYNFDVASGVLALLCAPLADRSKIVAWAFNVIGFGYLVNFLRVAIMSSPLPFAWDVEPKMNLTLHLPYALLGTVCLISALSGHYVLTRALLKRR